MLYSRLKRQVLGMKGFIDPLHQLEVFEIAKKHLQYKKTHINISGVTDSMVSHLAFGLLEEGSKVVITLLSEGLRKSSMT